MYFERARTTFTTGWLSPLQGGWYLLKPDLGTLKDLLTLVKHRFSSKWNLNRTFDLYNERPVSEPPCLDDDQGLFYCYFKYSERFNGTMDYVVSVIFLFNHCLVGTNHHSLSPRTRI